MSCSTEQPSGCIVYLVTKNDYDYLCVLANGEHYRFGPLTQSNIARLLVEGSERILVNIQNGYATRLGAPSLTSDLAEENHVSHSHDPDRHSILFV